MEKIIDFFSFSILWKTLSAVVLIIIFRRTFWKYIIIKNSMLPKTKGKKMYKEIDQEFKMNREINMEEVDDVEFSEEEEIEVDDSEDIVKEDKGKYINVTMTMDMKMLEEKSPPKLLEEKTESYNRGFDESKMETIEENMIPSEIINFAGFSPSSMKPESSHIIDIWAFTESQFSSVRKIAKELDRDNMIGYKAGLKIDHGTLISINLVSLSKTITIENNSEVITWNGQQTNASFLVNIAENAHIGKHIVKATISVSGLSIATLLLNVSISESESLEYQECEGDFQRINSAFASYSSKDRSDVLARIQGIKKIHPELDVFLDVLSLRSGDNWENKLNEHVPSKDKFYLFWSKSALESLWVEREWKMALEKRGIAYIDPVPLDDPRNAPPPDELSSLHFNDVYMLNIKYIELKNQSKK